MHAPDVFRDGKMYSFNGPVRFVDPVLELSFHFSFSSFDSPGQYYAIQKLTFVFKLYPRATCNLDA